MTTLVTGATGLVGGQACAALVDRGVEVRALVRRDSTAWLDGLGAAQVEGRLDSPDSLVRAMAGCDTVVHCAALYSYSAGSDVRQVNVTGTRTLVAAAAEAGVSRVVVTSSSVTCGSGEMPWPRNEDHRLGAEPVPVYFASKLAQEEAALEVGDATGVEVVLACPTVVLGGPSRRLVPSNAILLRYLLDPTRSTFSGGCNVVDAADVGRGLAVLAESGEAGRRYLLGGENVSWRTLHAITGDLAGVPGPFLELPTAMAEAASAVSELWARITDSAPLSTREEAQTVGRYYWYDDSRARALGHRSASARSAVASGLAWLLVEDQLPRWVREALRLDPEVRRARRLVPRPLPS